MIESTAQLAACLVAAVLATAVAAKLAAPRSWAVTATLAAGRPGVGRALAIALPAGELAVAVLVLVRPPLGLGLAAALFAALALAVGRLSRRLAGVSCGCFGGLLPSEIGPALAARNAMLAAATASVGVLAILSGAGVPGPAEALGASVVAATVALALRRRQLGVAPPRPGEQAPLAGLPPGRPTVLVFLVPGCPGCEFLAPRLQSANPLPDAVDVVAVIGPGEPVARGELAAVAGAPARLDLEPLFDRWNVRAAPYAAAVDRSGRLVDEMLGAEPAGLEPLYRAAALDPAVSVASRPELSRRGALGAAATAAFALSLPGGIASAGRVGRSAQAKRGSRPAAGKNIAKGTCRQWLDHSRNPGLRGRDGRYYPRAIGHTSEFLGGGWTRRRERSAESNRLICSCDGRMYASIDECQERCRAGLKCNHTICGPAKGSEACIEVMADLNVTASPKIAYLRWADAARYGKACKRHYDAIMRETRHHENEHVRHAKEAVRDHNRRNRNQRFYACGSTLAEARRKVEEAMSRRLETEKRVLNETFRKQSDAYHRSVQGKEIELDCDLCPTGKRRR